MSEPEHLIRFINAGIRGVRKVNRDIPVMLHLDQGNEQKLYREWFDNYERLGGEEFDIIGLSYYPVWNGKIKGLFDYEGNALPALEVVKKYSLRL